MSFSKRLCTLPISSVTDNIYTECAYYPGSGQLVVINNSDQPQTTGVQTKNGRVEISLEAYATKMLAVEG